MSYAEAFLFGRGKIALARGERAGAKARAQLLAAEGFDGALEVPCCGDKDQPPTTTYVGRPLLTLAEILALYAFSAGDARSLRPFAFNSSGEDVANDAVNAIAPLHAASIAAQHNSVKAFA